MLALDVVAEKLMEEATEVSLECGLLAKAASKTFRFGPESINQHVPEEGTNVDRLFRAFHRMEEEYRDLKAVLLLLETMTQSGPLTWPQIAQILPTREERAHARRHLAKMSRHARALMDKKSLPHLEMIRLEHAINGLLKDLSDIDIDLPEIA